MTEWDPGSQKIAALLTNRYELLERLGQGGFASVYKVRNLRLRRIEALKVLSGALTEEGDFARRFEQESRFAASLDHPNIAKIYDYGGEGDLFWFSMQFLDGPTLRGLLHEGGPIEPVRAARIALGALDALAYCHGRGIIHRDIKPDNVQLDSSRRSYLMDFGIAKSQDSAVKTQTGFVFGSPAYMSPEQIKGETLDPRTDIYSVGVTLYTMLSGSLPFSADDTFAAAMKKLSELPAPLSEKAPGLPPDLEEIVMRALARERAERFPGAVEMRDALGGYLDRARQAGAQDRTPAAPLPIPAPAPGKTPAGASRAGLREAGPGEATVPSGVARVPTSGGERDATTPHPRGTITPPSLLAPEAPGARGRRIFIVLLLAAVSAGVFLIVRFSQPGAEPVSRDGITPAAVSSEGARSRTPLPRTTAPSEPAAALPFPPLPPAATVVAESVANEPPPVAVGPREANNLPKPDPRYPIEVPAEIGRGHARESVGLMVTVAEDGTVKSARVISQVCPECDYAVLQAVRKARFKPARDAEGRPVEATFAFSYRF